MLFVVMVFFSKQSLWIWQAMEDALAAGHRRRSLAALATPVPVKRALKKSPGALSGSTVTPDPKRLMTGETGSASKSAESSSSKPVTENVVSPTVPRVELFPVGTSGDDMMVDDTQVDSPTAGQVSCNMF